MPQERSLDELFAAEPEAAPQRSLDELFNPPATPGKLAPPVAGPSLLSRAQDVGIGALKGVGQEITGVADTLGPLINKMAGMSFGANPARENVPSASDLLGLHASDSDQQIGKYIEAAASFASPFVIAKAKALAAAGKAAEARAVIETTARQMPPLVEATGPRVMPSLVPEVPVARQMKPLAEAASSAPRVMPRLVADVPTAGRLAGKPPSVTQALQDALEAARKPELPTTVSGAPAQTITDAGKEGEFFSSGRPATGTPTPVGAVAGSKMATRAALPSETAGSTKLGELLDAIHGEGASLKGNGTYQEAADTALKAGKVDEAASVIEKRTVLSVEELAKKMRAQYGSARAGKMLQPNQPAKVGAAQLKRLAPGASELPTFAVEDMARRGTPLDQFEAAAANVGKRGGQEAGAISPKVVAAIGGGALGAAAGATQGDTNESRAENAVMGGVAGAALPLVVAHAIASGSPVKAIQNYWFSALLTRPSSITKAWLGGIGGGFAAVHDLAMSGDVARAGALTRDLFSTGFTRGIVDSLKTGQRSMTMFEKDAPTLTGKIYDAVNEPAMRAMMKNGISKDDAMRYTLSGVPRTKAGQAILSAWNQTFALKALGSMFPRVGVQMLEHGIERSPLGLLSPTTMEGLGMGGLNQGPASLRAGRALSGAGTALAAYMGGDQVPEWLHPYVSALAGVYALPVGSGLAAGRARARGKDTNAQLTAGVQELADATPFPRYGPMEAMKQIASGSSFVPGAVADIARLRDPHERQTAGQGFFARTEAKIPGLRERLPVAGENVNIAGQPTNPRGGPLQQLFSTSAIEKNPQAGVPEHIANELQRLNVSINAPAFEKTIKVGTKMLTVPPDAAERARAERRQYLLPLLDKMIASDVYQRADDGGKAARLKAVITRAEATGSQRARATLLKTLQQSGALRGTTR